MSGFDFLNGFAVGVLDDESGGCETGCALLVWVSENFCDDGYCAGGESHEVGAADCVVVEASSLFGNESLEFGRFEVFADCGGSGVEALSDLSGWQTGCCEIGN